MTHSFDVYFDLRQKKRLSKQRGAGDLRHNRAHYDVTVMHICWQCGPSLIREMVYGPFGNQTMPRSVMMFQLQPEIILCWKLNQIAGIVWR